MVDGDTRLSAFRRIVVPLAAPGLVATAIFLIVWLLAPSHGVLATRLPRRLVAIPEAEVVFESPEIQTPHSH